MSHTLRFRPEVLSDMREASDWYDEKAPGLGEEFLQECDRSFHRLAERPQQGSALPKEIRAVRLHRFPYVVYYRIESKAVVVFAVLFGGRDPSVWRSRFVDS